MSDRKELFNRYVRISSEDRATGTASQFTVDLPTTGKSIDTIKSYSVKYLECPNVFPNVPSYKNVLNLTKTTGLVDYAISITSGQYTLTEFLAQLKVDIELAIPDTVTVTASAQNVLTFTFVGDTYAMVYDSTTTIAPIIGLTATLPAALSQTMQNMVNLTGETAVYFHSRTLNRGGTTEAQGNFSMFGVLALGSTPYGGTGYFYEPNIESATITYRTPQSFRTVDIVIRDRVGNVLVLPSNFSLSVLLKINHT